MRRFRRAAFSLASIAGQWYVLYNGINGERWGWNIFIFYMWVMTVALLLLIAVKYNANKWKPVEKSLPHWTWLSSDMLMTIYLAAFGHFFYATMLLIQDVVAYDLYLPRERAHSSSAERCPDMAEVAGSAPAGPTSSEEVFHG